MKRSLCCKNLTRLKRRRDTIDCAQVESTKVQPLMPIVTPEINPYPATTALNEMLNASPLDINEMVIKSYSESATIVSPIELNYSYEPKKLNCITIEKNNPPTTFPLYPSMQKSLNNLGSNACNEEPKQSPLICKSQSKTIRNMTKAELEAKIDHGHEYKESEKNHSVLMLESENLHSVEGAIIDKLSADLNHILLYQSYSSQYA